MKQAVVAISAAVCLQAAGQGPFGYHIMQVSTDGGETWQGGIVEVEPGPRSVLVRSRFSWINSPAYAFAGAQFDQVVLNAGPGDEVVNPERPHPYNLGSNQTIVATRFGSTIKIDDSRDTLAPGMGTRGVFPAQLVENFAPPGGFVRENPGAPFVFGLNLDGTPGDRTIDAIYIGHSGTGASGFRAYTSPAGAQEAFYLFHPWLPINARFEAATIRVVPGPGAVMALTAAGLVALMRRVRA